MKRSKPLKRSGRLRRTRLKAKGKRTKKSHGHLFPKAVDEAYRAFVRLQACVLSARHHVCEGDVQACHVKSRGASGHDHANMYPGCAVAHAQQHVWGIRTFQARWGINLETVARKLYEQYVLRVGS